MDWHNLYDFPFEEFKGDEDKSGGISLGLESLPSKLLADNVCQEPPEQEAISGAKTPKNPFNAQSLDQCNRDSHEEEQVKTCTRKFPGPAGVLPPYSPQAVFDKKIQDNVHDVSQSTVTCIKDEPYNLTWSQAPADDIFASSQWKALVSDLGPDAQSLLSKFSIKSALLKASRKLLPRGKIPLIIGVMDSLEMQGSDASFVIRDPTGKMNGALHRDLFKDPATALQAGSVLVLRQVSVISPSNRTHYLNITPGNVALVYSANRGAGVSKRPWSTSQELIIDSKFGTEIQTLHQIIEDSKQELLNSLRDFQPGSEVYMSPTLPLGSSKALVQTGFSRGRGNMSSFMPRGSLAVQRYTNNVIGSDSSSSIPSKTSLFTIGHRTLPYITQERHVTCSDISHSSTSTTENVNQFNSKRFMPNFMPVSPQASVEPSGKAVCNGAAKGDQHQAPNHHEKFGSSMISPVSRNLQQVNSTTESHAAFKDKSDGEDLNNLNSFHDDFPDDDEQMMLEMCDSVLEQTPIGNHRKLAAEDSYDYQCEFSSENMRSENVRQSVISKVFDECKKENQRITSISHSIYKPNSHLTNVGNSKVDFIIDNSLSPITVSLHSPAVSSQTSAMKKFSFRRTHPLSHTSLTSLPAKRPMYEIACQSTANFTSSPFSNRQFSNRQCSTKLNSDLMSGTENNENIPTVNRSSITAISASTPAASCVKLNKTTTNYPVTCVNPVVFTALPCVRTTGMPSNQSLYNKRVINGNSTLVLDSQPVQTGCDSNNSAAGHTTNMFPCWDNDLNDELLSQLDDDF